MTTHRPDPYCAIHDEAHRPCDPANPSAPERKPSARWAEGDDRLDCGAVAAVIERHDVDVWRWGICRIDDGATGKAATLDAAKLAAEDALLAIAAGIVGAVGR